MYESSPFDVPTVESLGENRLPWVHGRPQRARQKKLRDWCQKQKINTVCWLYVLYRTVSGTYTYLVMGLIVGVLVVIWHQSPRPGERAGLDHTPFLARATAMEHHAERNSKCRPRDTRLDPLATYLWLKVIFQDCTACCCTAAQQHAKPPVLAKARLSTYWNVNVENKGYSIGFRVAFFAEHIFVRINSCKLLPLSQDLSLK